MKHPVKLITALLLLLATAAGPVAAENLNVVYSGKWPPYADASLPQQGLGVDLVTTALQRAGYQTVLQIDSLDRILEGGKLGVYDVFATPWYSDERNEYLDYSKPYLQSYIRFVKKKGSDIEFNSFSDLNGLLIGVVQDYAYDEEFNHSRKLTRISERNLIQNLLKLKQGRLDLAVDDELVLLYEINQYMPNSRNDFVILPKPLAVRGIHIGVSRENPHHAAIVAAFDKAIEAMKKDGSYEKILQKHFAYIKKPGGRPAQNE